MDRFISALGFKGIHAGDADRTARDLLKKIEKGILTTDWGNHFQPQVDFIDDDVMVFAMEDNFFEQISSILGIPGPFPRINQSRTGVDASALSDEVKDHVRRIYAEDYRKFGYKDEI